MTSRHRPLAVVLVAFASLMGTGDGLRGQMQAVRRESISVAESADGTRLLATALELAAAGAWEQLLDRLDELERMSDGALVAVEPRRLVSPALAARIVRAQLPDEALADLRSRSESRLRAAFEEARLLEDTASLSRLWRESGYSSIAAAATIEQADACWRRGQLDEAAALWRLLRPSLHPVVIDAAAALRLTRSRLTPAELSARRILVEIFAGDLRRAAELTRRFRADFPETAGWLAGESRDLHDWLAAELRMAARSLSTDLITGPPLWRVPLLESTSAGRATDRPLLASDRPPPLVPAVKRDGLFWAEEAGVRGVRLTDGQPLWSTGPDGDDVIFGASQSGPYPYTQPLRGESRRMVAVGDERLWAVLGPGFSVESPLEARAIESRLIALDVGPGEGKLLWQRQPPECLPSDEWRFSGPPHAEGLRLWIPARCARPSPAIGVACLDAQSGRALWFQTIGSLLREPPRGLHLTTCDRVVRAGSGLLLSGDFGALACLDPATGRINWVRLDASLPAGQRADELAGRGVVPHRGQVFAISQDDATVLALDALTGALDWQQTVDGPLRQVVGVRGGVVVVAGPQLWGLDVDDGSNRWRWGFDDVEGAIAGDALLQGDTARVCTPDELWEIDVGTGEPLRRIPLRDGYGVAGGHLLAGEDRLLVVSPDEIVALPIH